MLGKIEVRRRGDDRGWDGWIASPTWSAWVWASSGSWWWTGKPGMLQCMGLLRVRHDWVTKPNFSLKNWKKKKKKKLENYILGSHAQNHGYNLLHLYFCSHWVFHTWQIKKKIISEYGCSSTFYCKESWIYVNRERIAIRCKGLCIITHYSSLIGF